MVSYKNTQIALGNEFSQFVSGWRHTKVPVFNLSSCEQKVLASLLSIMFICSCQFSHGWNTDMSIFVSQNGNKQVTWNNLRQSEAIVQHCIRLNLTMPYFLSSKIKPIGCTLCSPTLSIREFAAGLQAVRRKVFKQQAECCRYRWAAGTDTTQPGSNLTWRATSKPLQLHFVPGPGV